MLIIVILKLGKKKKKGSHKLYVKQENIFFLVLLFCNEKDHFHMQRIILPILEFALLAQVVHP